MTREIKKVYQAILKYKDIIEQCPKYRFLMINKMPIECFCIYGDTLGAVYLLPQSTTDRNQDD
jgi:NAD-dependent dihydropyrimidine dehydrogenase PreA subunit